MTLDDYFWPEHDVATGFIEFDTADGIVMLVLPGDPSEKDPGVHVLEPNCWILVEEDSDEYRVIDSGMSLTKFGTVQPPMFTIQGWTKGYVLQALDNLGLALLDSE
jgi:hypothetical protein